MKKHHALLFQGVYYLLTGLWPVIDIISFIKVTGPKTDIWLVKMVGLLTVSIAITILFSYRAPERSILILAVASAASYLFIDVFYYASGQIPAVYLGDAVIEMVIISLIFFLKRSSQY